MTMLSAVKRILHENFIRQFVWTEAGDSRTDFNFWLIDHIADNSLPSANFSTRGDVDVPKICCATFHVQHGILFFVSR